MGGLQAFGGAIDFRVRSRAVQYEGPCQVKKCKWAKARNDRAVGISDCVSSRQHLALVLTGALRHSLLSPQPLSARPESQVRAISCSAR